MISAGGSEPPIVRGTYHDFMDYLKDPDSTAPLLSPKRFCQALQINLQTLQSWRACTGTLSLGRPVHVRSKATSVRRCASSRPPLISMATD